MKKLLLLMFLALAATSGFAQDAIYAWVNGSGTCYQLESMPTVTYATDGGTRIVNLAINGENVLSLPMTEGNDLTITYGTYVSTTLKVNDYGLATFSCSQPVKFISGATPYTVKADYTGYTLTCTAIDDCIVPAYNGVMLKGSAANAEVTYTILEDNPSATLDNDLLPTTTAQGLATNDDGCYVLSGNTFGTYQAGYGFTANKAYLPFNTQEARNFTLVWENGATGITGVQDGSSVSTVQQKGKYIYGGKLVIIKNGKQYDASGTEIK